MVVCYHPKYILSAFLLRGCQMLGLPSLHIKGRTRIKSNNHKAVD